MHHPATGVVRAERLLYETRQCMSGRAGEGEMATVVVLGAKGGVQQRG